MPVCMCGAEVAYVYDVDDEIVVIDAERSEYGNVAVEGISGHLVAPGSGSHRVHECEPVGAELAASTTEGEDG